MRLSRRAFLASVGGATAGAAIYRAMGQPAPQVNQLLDDWKNYEEEFHASVCQQCPGGCGILGRVVDGNLVKISGNPLHPVNQGGLCMKGLAGTQVLYDPDRLRFPLERDGKRGSGKWKPIAWDEALDRVAGRLHELRRAGKSHTVAVLGGQYRGLIEKIVERFGQAYGTPNILRLRCNSYEEGSPSTFYMQGIKQPLAYDLEQARYILSFGCNLLESWISTVSQQKAFGRLRERSEGERAQLVVVDPRYSVTAAKADVWVAINPGTDAELALGLAHIIIQEGRYDTEFVRDRSYGFDDWRDAAGALHRGFKRQVLEDYPPEKVSAVTGVSVALLFKIARGFAGSPPALALGERGPAFPSNDLFTRMAIHSLNALVGSIGRMGGIGVQGTLPLKPLPEVLTDRTGRAGLARPRMDRPDGRSSMLGEHTAHELPRHILAGDPYEVNALFLYYANPVFSQTESEAWLRALEKIPLVVSFSPFLDETCQQADLILPDCTYLERWRDDEITHLAGITAFSLGAPVVAPLFKTRATEDVWLQIAARLGGPVAKALPWKSHRDFLYDRAQGLYEAGRGHIVMTGPQEKLESIQARQGYWQQQFSTYDEFWNELVSKGAWWDPNDTYFGSRQLIHTPSGKFEFRPQLLQRELDRVFGHASGKRPVQVAAALAQLATGLDMRTLGGKSADHPDETAAAAKAGQEYPLILNTYKLMSLAGGKGANQPWLQQEPAVHLEGGWESWVEVHPATAGALHIEDGDRVFVESARGRIAVMARIFAATAPGILNMPYGWGHTAFGHWAKDRGQNPNAVLAGDMDPLTGVPAWGGTRVRLRKV